MFLPHLCQLCLPMNLSFAFTLFFIIQIIFLCLSFAVTLPVFSLPFINHVYLLEVSVPMFIILRVYRKTVMRSAEKIIPRVAMTVDTPEVIHCAGIPLKMNSWLSL